MSDPRRPRPIGIDHLGVSVSDLARSEHFYCDILGATVIFQRHRSGWGSRTIVLLGSHAIDLNQFDANDGKGFDATRTGLDHIGLTAESLEDLELWAAWLDGAGVSRSPIRQVHDDPRQNPEAPAIGAMFDFVDPDGIQLEFVFLSFDPRQRQLRLRGM